jgi:hypothetical protein
VLVGTCLLTSTVHAALALTSAGSTAGFSLSLFATTNPTAGPGDTGPLGVAVTGNGNVIVDTFSTACILQGVTSCRYIFPDVDGQTTATALSFTGSNPGIAGYATAGGLAYGGESGQFVQFNNDGTVNHVLTGVTVAPLAGMATNPVNGHLITNSSSGMLDIDPLTNGGAGSFRTVTSVIGDGIAVSPDGSTAYTGTLAINLATGTFSVYTASINGADGIGAISSNNSLNGKVIVNANTGIVWLVDPTNGAQTMIATGGTRGDYASADPNNGSIFLDFSRDVWRLSCGQGCSIGSVPQVPVPGAAWLFVSALSAAGFVKRRKKY